MTAMQDHQDTQGRALDAEATARSPWLVLLLVLLVVPTALWSVPDTREMLLSVWASIETMGGEMLAVFPEPLRPMISKGAEVFLTPWLYLLMAVVFVAEKVLPADRR